MTIMQVEGEMAKSGILTYSYTFVHLVPALLISFSLFSSVCGKREVRAHLL